MQTPFQHTVREVLVPTLSHGHGEGTRPDPVRSCGDAARTRVAGFVSASWRRRRRRRRRINLDATRHRLVIRPTNPTNIGRRNASRACGQRNTSSQYPINEWNILASTSCEILRAHSACTSFFSVSPLHKRVARVRDWGRRRSSDDVKRYGARDYETDYTHCRLRMCRPAAASDSVQPGPFRDLPRQLSSRRSQLPAAFVT